MFTTRMSPKISVKPLATTKKSAASVRPFKVTTANWRRSSLALTISQTTTTAAAIATAMRRADHAPRRSACGVSARPEGWPSVPSAPGVSPAVGSSGVCDEPLMALTGIESVWHAACQVMKFCERFPKAAMSSTPKVAVSNVKAALAEAVGADVITTAPEELDAYTADTYWPALAAAAAGTPLARPEIVVRPRTEEEVAAVVATADAQRTPLVAWGGGSGTQGGALATHGGIVVDLRSLDRILEIDDTSMTVTAQAGVNGKRLEAELNARGLMLPHYPASVEWATVGGYIAARGSGVLSTRYGKIEDLLLSLRVVTPADGLIETVDVPRHAVGPELTQLFVGSEGTLGVITRATRRALQPGPPPSAVRMYEEGATRRAFAPVVGEELNGIYTVFAFEGEPE